MLFVVLVVLVVFGDVGYVVGVVVIDVGNDGVGIGVVVVGGKVVCSGGVIGLVVCCCVL